MRKALMIILTACLFLPAFAETKPVLSVMDFEFSDISKEDMKSVIIRLSSEIFKTGLYEIVDISQRETLLEEMAFSLSGAASEENLVEIGRLLSAQYLLF